LATGISKTSFSCGYFPEISNEPDLAENLCGFTYGPLAPIRIGVARVPLPSEVHDLGYRRYGPYRNAVAVTPGPDVLG